MTNEERILCSGIIHTASAAAGGIGGGCAQIPCSDNVLITSVQLAMAISLGSVFGIELDESAAKAAVATAATLTEAMGWIMVSEFEKQREYAA